MAILRTISQLDEIQDAPSSSDSLYFETSKAVGNAYSSKKIKIGTLYDTFDTEIIAHAKSKFKLYPHTGAGTDLDCNKLETDVWNLYQNNVTLNGVKTYTSIPKITAIYGKGGAAVEDSFAVNVGYAKTLLNGLGPLIGTGTTVDGDPNIGDDGDLDFYIDENTSQLNFTIPDSGYDSTEYRDENGVKVGPQICKQNGHLTIYGWLADSGDVAPQNAWVGLFGSLEARRSSRGTMIDHWVPIQISPWIIGTKSQSLQYVSFNTIVKVGLKLKIMTGFKVHSTNGGFASSRSIMYRTNRPNSFVGYYFYNTQA